MDGVLRQYIRSMEQNKRETSEAITQLLEVEFNLRQQLNRKRSSSAPVGPRSNDPDDSALDEISRSLRNIVGRLQTQNGSFVADKRT